MDIQVVRKTPKKYEVTSFDEDFDREKKVWLKIERQEKIDFCLRPPKEEEVFPLLKKDFLKQRNRNFRFEKIEKAFGEAKSNFKKLFFVWASVHNNISVKIGWAALIFLGFVTTSVYRADGSATMATLGDKNPTAASATGISVSANGPKISVSDHENRLADLEDRNLELLKTVESLSEQAKFYPTASKKDVSQDEKLEKQSDLISELEDQLKAIADQNEAVIDFSLALDYKSLIYKDKAGNLDLPEGNVKAEEVAVEKIIIRNEDGKNMAGEGKIFPLVKDENLDGLDDETLSDGKSAVVKTELVGENSKIFITPKASAALKTPLTVTEKQNGQYFKVEAGETLAEEIGFDWWVIETK